MHKIFEQIAKPTEIDEEKDFVEVVFTGVTYKFNMERSKIILLHKSHATIAAVTGKRMSYKSTNIEATSEVFAWLGIKNEVKYDYKKREGIAELKDGVISFF